jgi:S-adenosylmethionine:tRNA ribosyltransferase-isomerase
VKTSDFEYDLPPELIAQRPADRRDESRLLVLDRSSGGIAHRRFRDLPQLLASGDLLVQNESRVIPARLFARKPTGGRVEVLLLRSRSDTVWEVLVGGKRVRKGLLLELLDGPDGSATGARAEVLAEGERGQRVLAFDQPVLPLAERVGRTPLPPYIHSQVEDAERYQTVYARVPGSAAAPTAGLHFTPDLLRDLRAMGVESTLVTLHIGLDTFRPVTEERVEDHSIHTEHCVMPAEAAEKVNLAKAEGRRVVAVGTTSVRVLETAALASAETGAAGQVVPLDGPTDLFIHAGHGFKVVDVLITNFHLPRSTLLMLVSAFAGRELLLRTYEVAIREGYRFYSFGDAMLIL